MKRKPILGETLYETYTRRKEPALIPVVVTKVGRKYFTCQPAEGTYRLETQYHIANWRQVTEFGSATHHLYETPEEYEDMKETNAELCHPSRECQSETPKSHE